MATRPRYAQIDTLTAFFLYWDTGHVAHMVRAVSRFIGERAPLTNDERLLLEQRPHIPALADVPGDFDTDSWIDALARFGNLWPLLSPEVVPETRQFVEDWLGALWLGAVATSLSAQELMFTDDPTVRQYRGTRTPWTNHLLRLRPFLDRELGLFRDRGWQAPRRFVDQCRAFYCYGLEESAFLPTPPS